jgi:arylsulfatase A-like enzyme
MKTEIKPNILLLTIDSLRADHLGCYGYARNCSPNIDALAAQGVLFSQAITCGGQTPDSFPSILASLSPSYYNFTAKKKGVNGTSVAQVLKNAGYRTAAILSNNPWVSRYYGSTQGFDCFFDNFDSGKLYQRRVQMGSRLRTIGGIPGKIISTGLTLAHPIISNIKKKSPRVEAETLIKQSLSWLEQGRTPYFLWLHFVDVHHPYIPPGRILKKLRGQAVNRQEIDRLVHKVNWPGQQGKLTGEELSLLIDLYDGAIMYEDESIKFLLDSVHCRLDNTVVIVTADHGDEFGEHGKFGHRALYDESLHVPLIIAGPGIPEGKRIAEQVSLIDLAPTITSHLKIPSPPGFHGRSLLPILTGKCKAEEGIVSIHSGDIMDLNANSQLISYRIPGWKYIRTEAKDDACTVSSEEIYHLAVDPLEKDNLHGRDLAEAEAFASRARERIAQHRQESKAMKTDNEKMRIKAKLGKLRDL